MITTALLATLTAVNAQEVQPVVKPGKDPAVMEKRITERSEKRTAEMTTELALNTEQTAKVESINYQFTKAAAQLKQAGLPEDARKERMKVLRNTRDNQLKQALTEEQYQKMMELRKQRKDEEDKGEPAKAPHNE